MRHLQVFALAFALFRVFGSEDVNAQTAHDDDCHPGPCALQALRGSARLPRPLEVFPAPNAPGEGGYISSRETQHYEWTKLEISDQWNVEEALKAPFDGGWPTPFGLSAWSVARWLLVDLLPTSPFGNYALLVPRDEEDSDQLGHGGWVGYSRRQVCYLTAKSYLGAKAKGYNAGLFRLMRKCSKRGDFGKSFAMLLAACAADPTLADGKQGPVLLTAKAYAPPSVEEVRRKAEEVSLAAANLRACDYDTQAGQVPGVTPVPDAGCAHRSQHAPGRDFMTGGLPGQATQDISASWFGGYLFDSPSCSLGGGQDERLSVYFPEVTVLAYFLSKSQPFPQLRQPAWFLGARKFFRNLDGTARFDTPLVLADVPLDADLVEVPVAHLRFKMSSSRPFVAFMSENKGFFEASDWNMAMARLNRLPEQRDMGHGNYAFEKQVRAWYRSMALTSYDARIHGALQTVVKSVGAGPWMAGLWWGDSQLGFLAMWLGHALAATTWGGSLPIDYYLYADFTENPGNQCYVLAEGACRACLEVCQNPDPPHKAYWMPNNAYINGRPCVNNGAMCGTKSFADVLGAFQSQNVAGTWREIERKVAAGDGRRNVFDILLS